MPSLTPSATRIVDAAIVHFAGRGYDGASLNEIAEAVGMRKASLYAHFRSKDELFLEAFEAVHRSESAHARSCFEDDAEAELPGMRYCRSLIERYADSADLQFFLRTGYMPPSALAEVIDARHEAYLSQLETAFVARVLARQTGRKRPGKRAAVLAEVYLGIVDSVQVKLIYTTPGRASTRLDAMKTCLKAAVDTLEASR